MGGWGAFAKPRSAGPRCGDPTGKLSALWRPSPRDIQAQRPRLPNRRAGGRPSDARRASPLIPRLVRGLSAALLCKAASHRAPDIDAFASDGAERQAAQCWAAGRRSDRIAMSLYGGNVRAKLRLRAGCSQIAGPWGRPSDARRADALDSARGGHGPSDAQSCTAAHHPAHDIQPLASDGAERQAAQRGAAGRRSGREAKRFMVAMSERNSG